MAETIPGFAATGWQVLVAPHGTPAPIISKVSADLAKVVSDPDFKKRLANIGSYSRAMTPEQVLAFVDTEQKTWLPASGQNRRQMTELRAAGGRVFGTAGWIRTTDLLIHSQAL